MDRMAALSPTTTATDPAPLAFLLTGGGARAAYQVGVLRSLAKRDPNLRVPILTGVSAGAINVAALAAGRDGFSASVDELTDLWMNLSPERVFRIGPAALGLGALRWIGSLISGGSKLAPRVRGLVDTQPLGRLLGRALSTGGRTDVPIPGIRENLEDGHLQAVGLSTVEYATGRTVVWCEGQGIEQWERPYRVSVSSHLTVDHVMASAALPLLFPAVRLGDRWYGDGGVRLTSPLSPALHLGAGRIMAVSTRYQPTRAEAARTADPGYPSPAQVAGVLMNSVFLDLLDQDALHLERLNRLIEGDVENGLRPIDLLLLRPSQDLGRLAAYYEPRLPKGLRFLTRGLGSGRSGGSDFISMLMFQPDYISRLIELGEVDCDAKAEEVDRLLISPRATA